MPYFELLPFLPYEDITDKKDRILFQCPTSSFFLFYNRWNNKYCFYKEKSFNALLRASSFSTSK